MPEWGDLQTAGVVIMALICLVLTIDKLVDVFNRRLNQPKKEADDFRENTEERLKRGDAHMERQDEAIDLLLKSQMISLQHMAFGNHVELLKESINEIQKFLIDGREV